MSNVVVYIRWACDESLRRLGAVHENYWDRDWRYEHRGGGCYPEHHLWEAADGYLDLLDAVPRSAPDSRNP